MRVVAEVVGLRSESELQLATTKTLPEGLTEPSLSVPLAEGASPEGFLLGTAGVNGGETCSGPLWTFILNRQGRIVWYHDPELWQSMFGRTSRDGSHVVFSRQDVLDRTGESSIIQRLSLDGSYQVEVPAPGLGWAFDETDDGTLLYDRNRPTPGATLEQIAPDGTQTTLWDCVAWLARLDDGHEHCYTNTATWSAERNSVMWSTCLGDWIAELDRSTGTVLWYAGSLDGGLEIELADAVQDLQPYPNDTPAGTLIVSTHVPGTLEQVWVYGEGVDQWAQCSGAALRTDHGTTLVNHGTGGEGRTSGHTELVGDLHALASRP